MASNGKSRETSATGGVGGKKERRSSRLEEKHHIDDKPAIITLIMFVCTHFTSFSNHKHCYNSLRIILIHTHTILL